MGDHATRGNPKRSPLTLLAAGYLAILYLALCIIVFILGRQQIAEKNAPLPTITITPVPHILVNPPSNQDNVLYEDFSSNQREWGLYFHYGKIEVINGKLILQSDVPNGIGLGTSKQLSASSEKYYIQADFSTDRDTVSSYGLAFGLNKALVTYYLFEVWPQSASFRLFKYNSGKWTQLVPYSRTEINPYPQVNTLSVNFDKGHMELYINGKLVSDYSDKDFFQSKDIGVFVNSTGYRVFVDDFFVYEEK